MAPSESSDLPVFAVTIQHYAPPLWAVSLHSAAIQAVTGAEAVKIVREVCEREGHRYTDNATAIRVDDFVKAAGRKPPLALTPGEPTVTMTLPVETYRTLTDLATRAALAAWLDHCDRCRICGTIEATAIDRMRDSLRGGSPPPLCKTGERRVADLIAARGFAEAGATDPALEGLVRAGGESVDSRKKG